MMVRSRVDAGQVLWCVVMLCRAVITLANNERIILPDEVELIIKNNAESHSSRLRLPTPTRDLCEPRDPDSKPRLPCSLLTGRTPYKGECVRILDRGPCPILHWIVIDKKTGLGVCQFQVCGDHKALVAGDCRRMGEDSSARFCPPTQQLIVNEFGEAECECPAGRIYHQKTEKCYGPYTTGPCAPWQVIQVVEGVNGDGFGKCVPSLCPKSNHVAITAKCQQVDNALFTSIEENKPTYNCYELNKQGPCREGFLAVDLALSTVMCMQNVPYALFSSLPSRPCGRGSRRDTMTRCRSMSRGMMAMGSAINTTRNAGAPTVEPGLYSNGMLCPEHYFFLSGICVHLMNGT